MALVCKRHTLSLSYPLWHLFKASPLDQTHVDSLCVLGRQEFYAYICREQGNWLLEVQDASMTQSAG